MSISYATDDLGLFDLVDLLPTRPALRLPQNLLPLQEALFTGPAQPTTYEDLIDLWAEWKLERRGSDEYRPYTAAELDTMAPEHAWSPAICGPAASVAAGCQPAILSLDLRCREYRHERRTDGACSCVGELIYRHICRTCGHVDEARESENLAAEDAMDHAHPGWRELPILRSSQPDEKSARKTWLKAATDAYPAGWIEAGGPVRTARAPIGTRHVPGRTPFGGYDMGAKVTDINNGTSRLRGKVGVFNPAKDLPPTPEAKK